MEDRILGEIVPSFSLPRETSVTSVAREEISLENVEWLLNPQQQPTLIQAVRDLLIKQGVALITVTLATAREEEDRKYLPEYLR